jgi:uncharacterized protein YjbI with pentapeptide repeats
LSRADLTGANLRGADLTGANLLGADWSEAVLDGADLTDVIMPDGLTFDKRQPPASPSNGGG